MRTEWLAALAVDEHNRQGATARADTCNQTCGFDAKSKPLGCNRPRGHRGDHIRYSRDAKVVARCGPFANVWETDPMVSPGRRPEGNHDDKDFLPSRRSGW